MRNGSAVAGRWNTDRSAEIAKLISSLPSLYCGPASIGWIAAVWNALHGRAYDLKTRLTDRYLFPDGPRPFHGAIPFFETSLNELLKRETDGELELSRETYFRAEAIHDILQQFQMPLIVRTTGKNIKDGLHYVTLFRSEVKQRSNGPDQLAFFFQDNGLYGGHGGLSTIVTNTSRMFLWGARRIIEA